LKLEILPYDRLSRDEKVHMHLLPSTCLVQNSLLLFASGFMNYKAELLLKEQVTGVFRKPPGDVVLSNFSKIFDCPDIVEEFVKIWVNDYANVIINNKKQYDVDEIIEKTKKVISKIYPILYSSDFNGIKATSTSSSIGNEALFRMRKNLIKSVFSANLKKDNLKPVSEMTTFVPF
jgi:hypothetical protein